MKHTVKVIKYNQDKPEIYFTDKELNSKWWRFIHEECDKHSKHIEQNIKDLETKIENINTDLKNLKFEFPKIIKYLKERNILIHQLDEYLNYLESNKIAFYDEYDYRNTVMKTNIFDFLHKNGYSLISSSVTINNSRRIDTEVWVRDND